MESRPTAAGSASRSRRATERQRHRAAERQSRRTAELQKAAGSRQHGNGTKAVRRRPDADMGRGGEHRTAPGRLPGVQLPDCGAVRPAGERARRPSGSGRGSARSSCWYAPGTGSPRCPILMRASPTSPTIPTWRTSDCTPESSVKSRPRILAGRPPSVPGEIARCILRLLWRIERSGTRPVVR